MIFENITLSLVSLLFVLILLVFRLYMNKSHSIFGENKGNTLSTPSPNEIFLIVKDEFMPMVIFNLLDLKKY